MRVAGAECVLSDKGAPCGLVGVEVGQLVCAGKPVWRTELHRGRGQLEASVRFPIGPDRERVPTRASLVERAAIYTAWKPYLMAMHGWPCIVPPAALPIVSLVTAHTLHRNAFHSAAARSQRRPAISSHRAERRSLDLRCLLRLRLLKPQVIRKPVPRLRGGGAGKAAFSVRWSRRLRNATAVQ